MQNEWFNDPQPEGWWSLVDPAPELAQRSQELGAYCVAHVIAYPEDNFEVHVHPDLLGSADEEIVRAEIWRRMNSFMHVGLNGPYEWTKRASDGGYQVYLDGNYFEDPEIG